MLIVGLLVGAPHFTRVDYLMQLLNNLTNRPKHSAAEHSPNSYAEEPI